MTHSRTLRICQKSRYALVICPAPCVWLCSCVGAHVSVSEVFPHCCRYCCLIGRSICMSLPCVCSPGPGEIIKFVGILHCFCAHSCLHAFRHFSLLDFSHFALSCPFGRSLSLQVLMQFYNISAGVCSVNSLAALLFLLFSFSLTFYTFPFWHTQQDTQVLVICCASMCMCVCVRCLVSKFKRRLGGVLIMTTL